MSQPPPANQYTRLTQNRSNTFFCAHSLWRGSDHLLLIVNYGFLETYRRFYYRDIQQISIARTPEGTYFSLLFGLALLMTTGLLFIVDIGDRFTFHLTAVCASTAAVLLGFNLFRGPTCLCQLRTAVQTVELLTLNRLRIAQKALDQLRPLIESAQAGPATPEMVQEGRILPQTVPPRPLRPYAGTAHGLVFLCLLLTGLLDFLEAYPHPVSLSLFGHLLAAGLIITLVTALIKQRGSRLGLWLKRLTWGVLVFGIVEFYAGIVTGIVFAMEYPDTAKNSWEMQKLFAQHALEGHPWLRNLELTVAGFALFLSLAGFVLLSQHLILNRQSRPTQDS